MGGGREGGQDVFLGWSTVHEGVTSVVSFELFMTGRRQTKNNYHICTIILAGPHMSNTRAVDQNWAAMSFYVAPRVYGCLEILSHTVL